MCQKQTEPIITRPLQDKLSKLSELCPPRSHSAAGNGRSRAGAIKPPHSLSTKLHQWKKPEATIMNSFEWVHLTILKKSFAQTFSESFLYWPVFQKAIYHCSPLFIRPHRQSWARGVICSHFSTKETPKASFQTMMDIYSKFIFSNEYFTISLDNLSRCLFFLPVEKWQFGIICTTLSINSATGHLYYCLSTKVKSLLNF